MRSLLIIITNFTLLSISHSQLLKEKYSFSRYDYYDFDKQEYVPSKCDCDYIEKTLILKNDYTFILTEQSGRLSPEYTKIKGKWKIVNDSILSLSGEYYEGIFLDITWSDSFIIRNSTLNDGYINAHSLWDGIRLWEGFGDMLIPQKKKK